MQAVTFTQFGGPEVLTVTEIPRPVPHAHQVLVQVLGVAVDHVDTFVRSGAFQTPLATPHIVGRDLVGTVTAVADAASPWHIGDLVWTNSAGYGGRLGATAEYTLVDTDRLYPVPTGVDPFHLVAAVHSAATAAIVLTDMMQAQAGQSLLVAGGAGNVGRKFCQLATQMGLTVTTTSAPQDFAICRQMGSARCVDYHTLAALNGATFDHVIDTSGQVSLPTNLAYLAPHGQLTMITAPKASSVPIDWRHFYMQDQSIVGFVISHATSNQLARAAHRLNQAFAHHALLEDHLTQRHFSTAADCHTQLEAGTDHGQRFVLVPDSTD